ncbi:MAG: hypothetical protein IJN11_02480 [Oscillospiraceae bacterium]|nr:hypothetical protein [Oscillospiraceae bacterium]
MKQHEFDRYLKDTLQHADEQTASEIIAGVPLDAAARRRIADLCEQKLKGDAPQLVHQEGVGQMKHIQHWKSIVGAAACFVAVAGLAGILLLSGRPGAVTPPPPVEEITTESTGAESIETDAESTETAAASGTDPTDSTPETTGTHTENVPAAVTGVCSVPTMAPTSAHSETVTTTAPPAASQWTEQERQEGYRGSEEAGYIINVAYPVLQSSPDADAINALIAEHVDEMVQHCNEITEFYREELGSAGYENPDEIFCDLYARQYEILRDDADYLSIVWRTSSYVTSGAYPSNCITGLVIDKHTLQPVTLSDLYNVNDAFMKAADSCTRAAVQVRCGDQIEQEGIDPSVLYTLLRDDLQNAGGEAFGIMTFALTEKGVLINPGVAHVYGDYVDVEIPYEMIEACRK